jgi:hypothetical protein
MSMEPQYTEGDRVQLFPFFELEDGQVYVHESSDVQGRLIMHRYLFTTREGKARMYSDAQEIWYDINISQIKYRVGDKI